MKYRQKHTETLASGYGESGGEGSANWEFLRADKNNELAQIEFDVDGESCQCW